MNPCTRSGIVVDRVLSRAALRGLCTILAAVVAGAAAPVGAQQGANPASGTAPAQSSPPAHAHGKSTGASSGTDEVKAKGSYSIGILMGTQLHSMGMSPSTLSIEQMTKGVRAAMAGTKPGIEDQQNFQALIKRTRDALADVNKTAARQFLAENGKQPGVKTTASGLQYKVVSEGGGSPPQPTDQVTVNYRGTLLDGTEFDSSAKHGQAATFQVDHVIKGWQEALVLMKPGAKWELYIPPDLAYGDNTPPGAPIPPGSLLKFDVELLSIKPPAAAGPGTGAALPGAPGKPPGSNH
ncbi:MAG TPA: FKBP-type peptidyl-prolyl cis-trans isomerase [Steroidobacteraceae bacterium]|nr:FKBP-type peptidyl-prolyl cis-trans isomerase [Steroidobacteraceae bacterium]